MKEDIHDIYKEYDYEELEPIDISILLNRIPAKQRQSVEQCRKIMPKKRAEDYTQAELLSLKTINNKLYFQLRDFILYPARDFLFLTGTKGFGKSFNVLKALAEYCKNPSVILFKRNNKLEVFKPKEGIILKKSEIELSKLFLDSDAIVFDDIHYICEAVINKKFSIEFLIEFLTNVLEIVALNKKKEKETSVSYKMEISLDKRKKRKNKPIILISEDLLSGYADILNHDKLDKLLPHFGEVRFARNLTWEKREKLKNSINILGRMEVPPLDKHELNELFLQYGIFIDGYVLNFLYRNARGSTRAISQFIKEFNMNNITESIFISRTIKKLIKMNAPEKYVYLLSYPTIDFGNFNSEKLRYVATKFKTFRRLEQAVKKKEEQLSMFKDEIDGICHNIYQTGKCSGVEIIFVTEAKNSFEKIHNFKELCTKFKIKGLPLPGNWQLYSTYYEAYNVLLSLKKQVNMDEEQFDNFWKEIPKHYFQIPQEYTYQKKYQLMLDSPFIYAYRDIFKTIDKLSIDKIAKYIKIQEENERI